MGSKFSLTALPQFFIDGKKRFTRTGFAAAAAAWVPSDLDGNCAGMTVIITGGSRGIGKATAAILAARGAAIHIICREYVGIVS